ncbi:uncharacterized protein LOC141684874 [Apium graveolens]|uniref:uncharacterized protein LOC141684874 n=1 Tax=Apium graveolens TaxID=4045 RepID=UPI003D78B582
MVVNGRTVERDKRWKKPEEGWIKVNVDAMIFQENGIGCAAVIRDARGEFPASRCKKIAGVWRPKEAEAIAFKEALSWIIELQHKNCVFETDSRVLVQACNRAPDNSYFGTIVGDCIQLLKHINPVLFQFAFRSANSVAHTLARATYSMSDKGE